MNNYEYYTYQFSLEVNRRGINVVYYFHKNGMASRIYGISNERLAQLMEYA